MYISNKIESFLLFFITERVKLEKNKQTNKQKLTNKLKITKNLNQMVAFFFFYII
jgi:hypothetical protein